MFTEISLFSSYLKTAIRNLARHRIYSAINIIGIRKVLGASQAQILSLLSREFVLYIALSSLIAFPIAYYATNQWLQTFAYRTELGIGTFLLGSVFMFLVVLTTVTAQTLKAARANPADSLRDE